MSSDSEDDFLLAAAALYCLPKKKIKRQWVHSTNKNRTEYGEFHTLYSELLKDESRYKLYLRMNEDHFNFLLDLIEDDIEKQFTQFRNPVSAKERLVVTLRFLATGDSFRQLGLRYRMGFSTVRSIVHDVTIAIWKNLKDTFMPKPTKAMWKQIAEEYKDNRQFPNCIGSLDAREVMLFCPRNPGSSSNNYRNRQSVIVLALVDANYKFIHVDVGEFGGNSDGGMFSRSPLGISLATNTADIPEDVPLENGGEPMPHVMVGGQAFPLKRYLMRPYSRNAAYAETKKKIFNDRLIESRKTVEHAIAVLAARWRVFHTKMQIQPEFVEDIILACCCLHNMLHIDEEDDFFMQNQPNGLPKHFTSLEGTRQNSIRAAFVVRDKFSDYFNSKDKPLS